MLMEILSKAATVAMLSFVVSSMLAMGAGLTVPQIAEPLRNARLVILTLLANFVVMPLGALALAKVLWLDEPLGIGLLLLGCAAGAPFLPKLAELAKGNLAFAVGAMVLLMVVTIGYLPVVLPLLLPGVTVDPWQIARSLLLLMLLPLVIGLALKAYYGDLAARVKPALDWISNVSLILLVCLITAANIDKVLQVFGTRGILAGILFIALGLGTGWLLGGPGHRDKTRHGARYRTAQHCRRARGRESKLQRPESGCYGNRRRHCRIGCPHAAFSGDGQSEDMNLI